MVSDGSRQKQFSFQTCPVCSFYLSSIIKYIFGKHIINNKLNFRALVGEQELMKPNVSSPAIPSTGKRILDARHKLCLHNQGCLKYFFQVY